MNLNNNYNNLESDLNKLFKSLNINNKNIFITCNLEKLGKLKIPKTKKVNCLYEMLTKNIPDDFTIFVPTPTLNLCNTNIPFDKENTKSHNASAFAELIRNKSNAIRSSHPFWSVAGLGKKSKLLSSISKHAYGAGSIWSKLLDIDCLQINFGMHPSKAVTLIHHIETIVGVPYRYTKEFFHPIKKNNKVNKENFYLSVMYDNTDITKKIKLNEHFFNKMDSDGKLNYSRSSLGYEAWSFKMKDFYNVALEFFKEDMYTYLEFEPKIKPYRK